MAATRLAKGNDAQARKRPALVRTNIVIDRDLVEEVKRRTGAKSARDAVQMALERVGGRPDYSGLLELWKSDPIRPFYDPKDPMAEDRALAVSVQEERAHYEPTRAPANQRKRK